VNESSSKATMVYYITTHIEKGLAKREDNAREVNLAKGALGSS
jgi:hypothetical protein